VDSMSTTKKLNRIGMAQLLLSVNLAARIWMLLRKQALSGN
jgi:hypothetical protein